jgi:hypothetical protein
MHRHVKKGIALSALDRVIGSECRIDICKRILLFRVLNDPVARDGLKWRKNFICALLAECFAKKTADIMLRWSKHRFGKCAGAEGFIVNAFAHG